jgi:hypothetical protein
MARKPKELTTHQANELIKAAKKNKQVSMSPKLLEQKSARDYIIDELKVSDDERKTRREVVYDLVNVYHMSRPQAYHLYNQVISVFNPKFLVSPEELQEYLLEEYQTIIDTEYSKIEPDGRAVVAALNGIQKLKENWIIPAPKEEDMPIPLLTSDPKALGNHKPEMDKKVAAYISKFKAKGVTLSPMLIKLAETVEFDETKN